MSLYHMVNPALARKCQNVLILSISVVLRRTNEQLSQTGNLVAAIKVSNLCRFCKRVYKWKQNETNPFLAPSISKILSYIWQSILAYQWEYLKAKSFNF